MQMYACISLFLSILHEIDSLEVKSFVYTEKKGEEVIGIPLESSKIDVLTRCAIVCLANSCKAYHIITSEKDLLCEVFGNEQVVHTQENNYSVYYG